MKRIYSILCVLSTSLSAFAAQYTSLAVSGSAVEDGGDFAMKCITDANPSAPRFVAYLQLKPGSFTLNGTDASGNSVVLGRGETDGVMAESGSPVEISESSIVRITLNSGDNSYEILPIESLDLKGSIVPDNTSLAYAGRGVWRSTVTLDKAVDNRDYPAHNFYFVFNNDENLAVKRLAGKNLVGMPSQGANTENIRLNNGTYQITLDMADHTFAIDGEIDPLRVSVFGSSVANGTGATNMEGYAYMFGEQLKQRHADGLSPNALYTSGVSIGGNNTGSLLNRYDDLIHDFGKFVIIGLSMGNEGIHDSANPDNVFNGFRDNMLALIARMRADGKYPVVVNNYARSDFNERDYSYIKQMNMLIHQWDVPSVNSLGAIEDGRGRWSQGYIADPSHPNTSGHCEFMYAFVPSLFDALIEGKPLPERDTDHSTTLDRGRTLRLAPEGKVHPFTLCVRVKGMDAGRLFSFAHGAGSRPFEGSVIVDANGAITYNSPLKAPVSSAEAVMADGQWHDVALSHYFARGLTILYVDGVEVGSVAERLTLGDITFGDDSVLNPTRDFAEISFWRSGMNSSEMEAHHQGKMLKSSLEIYSPMEYDSEGRIANLAQSTNSISADEVSSATDIEAGGDKLRISASRGCAVFYGARSSERIYSVDGHLAATVEVSPEGTAVDLAPGMYIAGNTCFAVR